MGRTAGSTPVRRELEVKIAAHWKPVLMISSACRPSGPSSPSISNPGLRFVANLRIGDRLLVTGAGFLAAAWEEMPLRVEDNLDAGVAHAVAIVGGGFALGDQLAGEESE
jgi:hypothetical protein